MKIAIIGAGASALFCGGFLAEKGCDVTFFDGNEKAGKKLFITGKGRCNLTNACLNNDFFNNVINGEKFLLSSVSKFSAFDTIKFFEERGLKTKIERGNRVFPLSDKSSDVIKVLTNHCKDCKFCFDENVISIEKQEVFVITTSKNKTYEFDKVVIATGGKSYSATGSFGDGYRFAKEFGHSIVEIKPALVPIELKDEFIKKIQGLSLKNVQLIANTENGCFKEFGEMLFTNNGISGPIVLSLSSKINRFKNIELFIDFKPALDSEKLEQRLLRDFEQNKNKSILNVIKGLLPVNLVDIFLEKCNINKEKKTHSITVEERIKILQNLKCFLVKFKQFYDIDCAIITSGGVDLKQINPKTMESKIVKDLYFIGEVLDVDALTGGFNLQIAFSTAYAMADNV